MWPRVRWDTRPRCMTAHSRTGPPTRTSRSRHLPAIRYTMWRMRPRHRIAMVLLLCAAGAAAQGSANPAAVEAWKQGNEKLRSQDWQGALEDFNRAIAADPHYMAAYQVRSTAEIRLQKYPEAIADANHAIEAAGGNPALRANGFESRSRAEEAAGDFEPALADLNVALNVAPQPGAVYMALADFQGRRGQSDAQMTALAQALTLTPENRFLWSRRAALKRQLGDSAGADADAARAQALTDEYNAARQKPKPAPPSPALLEAEGLVRAQRFRDAEPKLRQVEAAEPANEVAANLEGVCLLRLQKYSDAEKAFQRALALDPHDYHDFSGLLEAMLSEGHMADRDKLLQQVRDLAAQGEIPQGASWTLDRFTAAGRPVEVIEFAHFNGRFLWKYVFNVADAATGSVLQQYALESDQLDQARWAQAHAQAAALGER